MRSNWGICSNNRLVLPSCQPCRVLSKNRIMRNIYLALLVVFTAVRGYGQCVTPTIVATPDNYAFCYEAGVDHTYNIEVSPLEMGEDGFHIYMYVSGSPIFVKDVTTHNFSVTNSGETSAYAITSFGAGCESDIVAFQTKATTVQATHIESTECDDGIKSTINLKLRAYSFAQTLIEFKVYGSPTASIGDGTLLLTESNVGNGQYVYVDANIGYDYYILEAIDEGGCVSPTIYFQKTMCPSAPVVSNVPVDAKCSGEEYQVTIENSDLAYQKFRIYRSHNGVNYGVYYNMNNTTLFTTLQGGYYRAHSMDGSFLSTEYAEFVLNESISPTTSISLDMAEYDDENDDEYYVNCVGANEISGSVTTNLLNGAESWEYSEPIETIELFGVWKDELLVEQTESIYVFTMEEIAEINANNTIAISVAKNLTYDQFQVISNSPTACSISDTDKSYPIDWLDGLTSPTSVENEGRRCYDDRIGNVALTPVGGGGLSYNFYQRFPNTETWVSYGNVLNGNSQTVPISTGSATNFFDYKVSSVDVNGCESEAYEIELGFYRNTFPSIENTSQGNVGAATMYSSCGDVATINMLLESNYFDGVIDGAYQEITAFRIYGYNGATTFDNLIDEITGVEAQTSFDISKLTDEYEEYIIVPITECPNTTLYGKKVRIIWTQEAIAPIDIVDYHSNTGGGTIEFTITQSPEVDFNHYYYWYSDTLNYILHWDKEGVNNGEYYYDDDSRETVSYTIGSFEGDSFSDTLYLKVQNDTQWKAESSCVKVKDELNIPFYFEWLKAPEPFTLSTNTIVVCREGELSGASIVSPDATTEYLWYNSEGTLLGSGENYLAPVYTGDIKVVGVKNGIETEHIDLTVEVTLTDTDNPIIQSENTLCNKGDMAKVIVEQPLDGITYTWLDVSDNVLSNGLSYEQQIDAMTVLKLYGTKNGCNTDTTSIELNYLIDRSIDNPIIVGSGSVCRLGEVASLSIGNVNETLSYTWFDNNNNVVGTGTSIDYQVNTYENLLVVGANGSCQTDASIVSMSHQLSFEGLTVNYLGETTVCREGGPITLLVDGPDASLVYEWYNIDGLINTGQTLEYELMASETIQLVGKLGECVTDTTNISLTVELLANEYEIVVEGIGFECMEGSETTLSVVNSLEGFSYNWSDNNNESISAEWMVQLPVQSGNDVKIVGAKGSCATDTTTVTLSSSFDNSEAITASATESFVFEQIEFSTNLVAGDTYNYQWNFGDGNSSIESNTNHQYAAKGEYLVELLLTDPLMNCETTLSIEKMINVFEIVSAVESDKNIDVEVYPNPTSSELKFRIFQGLSNYKIINNQGRIILQGGKTSSVDVSSLKAGSYFILLIDGDEKTYLRKFIKE